MSDLRKHLSLRPNRAAEISVSTAAGFLGSAMGSLWADDGKMPGARLPGTPKAKSVIYLFMCGGVSHIDTFDPKDNKYAGQDHGCGRFRRQQCPDEASGDSLPADFQAIWEIRNSGFGLVSAMWAASSMRSRWCGRCTATRPNHFPAVIEACHRQAAAAVRASVPRQLGHLCAGHGEQESSDVREYRPALFAGSIDRRLSGGELTRPRRFSRATLPSRI